MGLLVLCVRIYHLHWERMTPEKYEGSANRYFAPKFPIGVNEKLTHISPASMVPYSLRRSNKGQVIKQ